MSRKPDRSYKRRGRSRKPRRDYDKMLDFVRHGAQFDDAIRALGLQSRIEHEIHRSGKSLRMTKIIRFKGQKEHFFRDPATGKAMRGR